MENLTARLSLIALLAMPGMARAESPCHATTTAPPAEIETVTCAEGAISRFFLISPTLSSLSADQRAAVITHPLHYAFAYMSADAVNRLRQGFADKAVTSIDYKAILTAPGAKGEMPHQIFELRMDRATASKIDWKTLPPTALFKLAPSHLSHWLVNGMAKEDAKAK
jgi:hypothetical protein